MEKALYGFKATKAGIELFTKLAARSQPVEIVEVMFGTGKMPDGSTVEDLVNMTNLVAPLAPGTTTTPIYDGDTLSLVCEFRSDLNGGLENVTWLNEFGLFFRDPDGEGAAAKVMGVYATLGDYPDSVLPYEPGKAPTIRDYPISVTIGAAEVVIDFTAAAFITSEDAQRLIDAAVKKVMAASVALKTIPITIPVSAWQAAAGETGRNAYYADVEDETVSASHIPDAVLDKESLDTAAACGLAPTVQSMDGALRFFAEAIPAAQITGSCRLWKEGGVLEGGGGEPYALPVATTTTLGGIKASDSVAVDPDGTAHAFAEVSPEHIGTEDDTSEMLDEVFGPNGGGSAE